MNYRFILKTLGSLLLIESIGMAPSLFISMYNRQNDMMAFIITIAITGIIGFALTRINAANEKVKAREGLVLVSLGWILVSLFGCLPFIISGVIPSFVDAFFETVSGFTTTGATILGDVEVLPRGLLFWRSFSHWLGGMGILVFTIAVIPAMGAGGFHVFKAEATGPTADKIVPRMKDTAKILYITYSSITLAAIFLLKLGGMTFFESSIHAFGTIGTGGFSTRNASIGAFDSTYTQVVVALLMVLSGVNFYLYFTLYKRKWKDVIKNEELRFYLSIVLISTILVSINIKSMYHSLGEALRHAFFQVSSIITTTGYMTVNFDEWPTFSKGILFVLMFVGGCAGSTAGSIKVIRILALLKQIKAEILRLVHPRAVISVKIDNHPISAGALSSIASFFILYIIVFVLGTLVVSLEGVGLVSAASAVSATLGNIGPGFEFVGPLRNFGELSIYSKLLLSLLMLLGRLELFTLISLFIPRFWK
ncbi:MAG: TrkH family potassium uptake protein [Clostridiaceae bacterium]|nr:TrkH family potassium uptake protein [Clostridiaceae bacterium]